MIRRTVIPVAWLMAACVIIGAAAGVRAHAGPLSPGEYYALNHAADICAELDRTPTVRGVQAVMNNVADTTRLSDWQVGEAVATSVFLICPGHVSLLKRYVAVNKAKGTVA